MANVVLPNDQATVVIPLTEYTALTKKLEKAEQFLVKTIKVAKLTYADEVIMTLDPEPIYKLAKEMFESHEFTNPNNREDFDPTKYDLIPMDEFYLGSNIIARPKPTAEDDTKVE